jgi:hypothetical protein
MQGLRSGNEEARNYSDRVLTQIRESGNLWMHVDTILEHAREAETKMYALSLLEFAVETMWNAI